MPEPASAPALDPARCPLCSGGNGCALETQKRTGQPQPPCWCTRASFPADLLDRVPAAARGQACVCAACAQRPAP